MPGFIQEGSSKNPGSPQRPHLPIIRSYQGAGVFMLEETCKGHDGCPQGSGPKKEVPGPPSGYPKDHSCQQWNRPQEDNEMIAGAQRGAVWGFLSWAGPGWR